MAAKKFLGPARPTDKPLLRTLHTLLTKHIYYYLFIQVLYLKSFQKNSIYFLRMFV